MGSSECLVHMLQENGWVLLKFSYLNFGHLSDTPGTLPGFLKAEAETSGQVVFSLYCKTNNTYLFSFIWQKQISDPGEAMGCSKNSLVINSLIQ